MAESDLSYAELQAEVRRLRAALDRCSALPAQDAQRRLAIFDGAIDFAMVVLDPTGIISDWNSGAERLLGWTAEEIRGAPAERFFTPEDNQIGRATLEMQLALRDGRAEDERWHLRRDGSRFWASGEMHPLHDDAIPATSRSCGTAPPSTWRAKLSTTKKAIAGRSPNWLKVSAT